MKNVKSLYMLVLIRKKIVENQFLYLRLFIVNMNKNIEI